MKRTQEFIEEFDVSSLKHNSEPSKDWLLMQYPELSHLIESIYVKSGDGFKESKKTKGSKLSKWVNDKEAPQNSNQPIGKNKNEMK